MQRGTCFINYEDFRECFRTYKMETKSIYCIQTSVSVQYYNKKNGTNIREDIIFTQVKFCCCKLLGHNGKRKTQENICPAYFFLQYDESLDRLVLKEECSTHVHSEEARPPAPSLVYPLVKPVSVDLYVPSKKVCEDRLSLSPVKKEDQENFRTAPSIVYPLVQPVSDLSVPSKKLCEDRLSLSPVKKEDQENFEPESPCNSQMDPPSTVEEVAKSHEINISSDSINPVVESVPQVSVTWLSNLLQKFQAGDAGSRSSLSTDCQDQMIQVCFQTSKMNSFFVKFPESLLIHQVASKHGCILYTFLVENKERMGKVVHFCFVKDDEAKVVSRMLRMFKDFNSEWAKIKVVYIDMSFKHVDILKEAFPSAQILLSVYHTVCLIQKKMKGHKMKGWLRGAIDDAIYQTSPEKLSFLAEKLQHKLDKELHDKLCTDWFTCELLWYMHVKKGLHACSIYMDSLGLVMDTISSLLAKQTSMEHTIEQFVESADCFNSKGLENQRDGTLGFSKRIPKVATRKKGKRTPRPLLPFPPTSAASLPSIPVPTFPPPAASSLPSTPASSLPSTPAPSLKTRNTRSSSLSLEILAMSNRSVENTDIGFPFSDTVVLKSKAAGRPQKPKDSMLNTLREHCNNLGFQLCSKEWEVIQKSTHLINVKTNYIAVQILEESHEVPFSGNNCSCYFQNFYKLPCRHILSMLYAQKKPVTEEMVSLSWQNRYTRPISNAKVSDTVLYYSKSEEEAKERVSKIQSLAKELSNLLLQCDGSEIQVRVSTLQMIMDMWRSQASANKDCLATKKTNPLPYQWVKKEPEEGEENSGCYELQRLDHCPAMN